MDLIRVDSMPLPDSQDQGPGFSTPGRPRAQGVGGNRGGSLRVLVVVAGFPFWFPFKDKRYGLLPVALGGVAGTSGGKVYAQLLKSGTQHQIAH